ncbi:MAG TPA: hypothetical protein VHG72_02990 [Polyangia bacterium]|nr:hypothetical protein [Polyangia bacterium]
MAKLVAAIERALAASPRAIYVVYHNPVGGDLFDASPAMRGWARMIPCAPNDRGYGPEIDDAIVIWQGGTAPVPVETLDKRSSSSPAGAPSSSSREPVRPGAGTSW